MESLYNLAELNSSSQIARRLDELFEQVRLASDARAPELLSSILRKIVLLNDIQADIEAS